MQNSTTPEGQDDRSVIKSRAAQLRTAMQDRLNNLDIRKRIIAGGLAVAVLIALVATAVGAISGTPSPQTETASTVVTDRDERADRSNRDAAAAKEAEAKAAKEAEAKAKAAEEAQAKAKAAKEAQAKAKAAKEAQSRATAAAAAKKTAEARKAAAAKAAEAKKAAAAKKAADARATAAKKAADAKRAATRWVYPMANFDVTSCYEYRTDPYPQYHKGIDFANVAGYPIRAAHAGTVISAGDAGDGYGNKVVLSHGNNIWTLYGHASRLAVQQGQKVAAGQTISYEGSTGDSTGPHLHFEVWAGSQWNQVNPADYLRGKGLNVSSC